jgi:hypothetical protein
MMMHRARGQGLLVGRLALEFLVQGPLEGHRMERLLRRRRRRMTTILMIFRVLHRVLLPVRGLRGVVCLLRDLLLGWRVYLMRLYNLRWREERSLLLNLIILLYQHSICLLPLNHCARIRKHSQHPRLAWEWE